MSRAKRIVVEDEDEDYQPHDIVAMQWAAPDYADIMAKRIANLKRIRLSTEEELDRLRRYYGSGADGAADFINDWGITFDPRNAEIGLPTVMPFVLFERQREWIHWVYDRWLGREPGICEKSRDMGVSWLAMALSSTLCLFHRGIAVGVGSRKSEYVDKIGTHKPLLPKARMFIENLPREFIGDWVAWRDAPYMRVTFPSTGSIIAGEGGDDIGRGDRSSLFFVDEAAHLKRGDLVDAALSQTTNCRIDMSSVNGMNNSFARKRHEGKIDVFIFDYRDDPRKSQEWYDKQCEQLDPVVVAQEIDRDYQASVTGVVIPNAWAKAAIDAHAKLGIAPAGRLGVALDIADEGKDKNAAVVTHGTEVIDLEEWSGKGGDIYHTAERVFEIVDRHGADFFEYDADGLGAGMRGDARKINEARAAAHRPQIRVVGFRGSGSPFDPEGIVDGTIGREGDKGRMNQDYFANHKAQSWWALRKRFQLTHRWVVQKIPCDPDDIISISPKCPHYMKLIAELSQATYEVRPTGKMLIKKTPPGQKSPNLADAVVIRFAPKERPALNITPAMIQQIASIGRGRRRY